MDVAAVQRALLDWYGDHARDLPWRRPPHAGDPYAVLVAEMMLQQTRVDVAAPYFDRWMARFPDLAALADASEQDAMAAWSGLGYYRRAAHLLATARACPDGLPATPEALRGLPGIGAYTAGAVASIAWGAPVPAVDGNVLRVLARLAGEDDPVDRGAGRRRLAALAASLVPPQRAGDWNQALMDLGATVCTPRAPRCPRCPLRGHCASRDEPEARPVRGRKPAPLEMDAPFALVRRQGAVLLRQADAGLLAGTLLLPGGPGAPLPDTVRAQTGLEVELADPLPPVRHVFSHRAWTIRVHPAQAAGEPREGVWVPEADLPAAALSTAMRRALRSAGIDA